MEAKSKQAAFPPRGDKQYYEHDCDNCVFLGNTIGGMRIHDLYYCKSPSSGDITFIARYSDNVEDYCSGIGPHRPGGHAELFIAQTMYNNMLLTDKA